MGYMEIHRESQIRSSKSLLKAKAVVRKRDEKATQVGQTATPPPETDVPESTAWGHFPDSTELFEARPEPVPFDLPREPGSFAEGRLPVSGQTCRRLPLLLPSSLEAASRSPCHLPDPKLGPPPPVPQRPRTSPAVLPQPRSPPPPDPDSTRSPAGRRAHLTSDP